MTNLVSTTKSFIDTFESTKNQHSLQQYFDQDDTQKLFTQVVIRAVQEDVNLLNADRASLFLACQSAAQDGLLPDRKEGALVIYNTKSGDRWIKKVQWQPMIGGIRKKLANHGFNIRAEVVYENDEFAFEMGDDPKIIHRPPGFQDRGAIIGAYAIATDANGNKYRETMDLEELEKVRQSSRNADGDIWTKWRTEMYRKTVAKRLFKQLPLISTDVYDLINRDNEQFEPASNERSVAVVQLERAAKAAKTEPVEGELVPSEPSKPAKKKVAKKVKAKKEPDAPDMGPEPPPIPDDELEQDPLL
jgi:recombination protein RecT